MNKIALAKELFKTTFKPKIKRDNFIEELDCHDKTSGTAYVQLLIFVDNRILQGNFNDFHLIVGRGSNDNERRQSEMKTFLTKKIEENRSINWKPHPNNPGALKIWFTFS